MKHLTQVMENYIKDETVKEKKEEIVGGKADGMTVFDVAKLHNADVKDIKRQLAMGIKVEIEHTNKTSQAIEIALDHLYEIPDYYDRLDEMEKEAGVQH